MADTKWRTDTGNTSDAGKWDAGVPSSIVNALFDAGSFTAAGQTVTVDAPANCLSMDWTGATNSPTFAGAGELNIYGSLTFITAMTRTQADFHFRPTAGTKTITTAGRGLATVYFLGTGTSIFQDATVCSGAVDILSGVINTNGQAFTCASFNNQYSGTVTLTLGATIVTCTSWNMSLGSRTTLTANTSTINCSGNFSGGGLLTYWIVNLNGNACAMSGSNKFFTLTRVGTAAASTWVLAANQKVTGICTMTGNSAVNRLTISSSVPGTKRRILASAYIPSNCDISADIELGYNNMRSVNGVSSCGKYVNGMRSW